MKLHSFLWLAVLLGGAATATAQQLGADSHVVTLIVPYAPGGPSDIGARRIAPELQRELGQTVVVLNIAGATGAIATQKLVDSAPDGLTLMYGSQNELILVPATNPSARYKPQELASVGLIVKTPLVLVTHAGAPYHSADELVAYLRTDPQREVTYGSPGSGSIQHLAALEIASQAHLRMVHVPYKGAGPMLTDLLGQHIDVSAMTLTGGTLDYIRSGKLRSLGVLSLQRTPLADDLSTINEGATFKDVDYSSWGGIFVTARTPLNIQQHLNDALRNVMLRPDLRAAILANGGEPAQPMSLPQLSAQYASETARYLQIAGALH
jgi:tripartite-type tricarboxylate transporter receptor subunit TctC